MVTFESVTETVRPDALRDDNVDGVDDMEAQIIDAHVSSSIYEALERIADDVFSALVRITR